MKVAVVLIVFAIVGAIWFLFFTNKPLKSSEEIDKMVIFYNEKQADLLPDVYEQKKFRLTGKEEIQKLGDLLLGLPLPRQPLFDSKNMDEGENWLINIYFAKEHRYIYVDKNINASLYGYLRTHYKKEN